MLTVRNRPVNLTTVWPLCQGLCHIRGRLKASGVESEGTRLQRTAVRAGSAVAGWRRKHHTRTFSHKHFARNTLVLLFELGFSCRSHAKWSFSVAMGMATSWFQESLRGVY